MQDSRACTHFSLSPEFWAAIKKNTEQPVHAGKEKLFSKGNTACIHSWILSGLVSSPPYGMMTQSNHTGKTIFKSLHSVYTHTPYVMYTVPLHTRLLVSQNSDFNPMHVVRHLLTLKMEHSSLITDGECAVIFIIDSNDSSFQLYGGPPRSSLHFLLRLRGRLIHTWERGRRGGDKRKRNSNNARSIVKNTWQLS